MDKAGSSSLTEGSITVDMSQLSALLDNKLDQFKREFTEESSSQLHTAVKRARLAPVSFKKKGCEVQYLHNDDIKDKLEEAVSNIDVGKIEKAKVILEEGIELINKRQKVIKIADNHGWDTVEQYVMDDLASDSDDDKRLSKAVRDAEYKRRERDRKRRKSRADRGRSNFRATTSIGSTFNTPVFKPASQGVIRSYPNHQACWSCGQVGHLQYQCPKKSGGGQQEGNRM
jgi:hypothetical protein